MSSPPCAAGAAGPASAPPLTITDAELALGLTILDQAIADIAS